MSTELKITKQLRQDLDEMIEGIGFRLTASREKSLVITKLDEAVMWLGRHLKKCKTPNINRGLESTDEENPEPTFAQGRL